MNGNGENQSTKVVFDLLDHEICDIKRDHNSIVKRD